LRRSDPLGHWAALAVGLRPADYAGNADADTLAVGMGKAWMRKAF